MEINRHNCEAFFLLYTDNELNEVERKAVDDFVAFHADLYQELQWLKQTRLPADEIMPFLSKEVLYKSEIAAPIIHQDNYEAYFLLYVDAELNDIEKKAVEDFIAKHPRQQQELALLQRVKLQPDEVMLFANKTALFRTEKTVIRMTAINWRRMVAAASIIAIGGWIWMNAGKIIPRQAQGNPLVAEEQLTPPPVYSERKDAKAEVALTDGKLVQEPLAAGKKAEKANDDLPVAKQKIMHSGRTLVEDETQKGITLLAEKIEISIPVIAAHPTKPSELLAQVPAAFQPKVVEQNTAHTKEMVKPVKLSQAAFQHKNKNRLVDAVTRNDEGMAYLDTDNTEKKSKGKFRGLFRRASRLVDHLTNPDISDKQSVVRVANFEIVKK